MILWVEKFMLLMEGLMRGSLLGGRLVRERSVCKAGMRS